MLAGGGSRSEDPFKTKDPSRFNAGAEETCPHASGGQEREVDWLLQKPEFCVICFLTIRWLANLILAVLDFHDQTSLVARLLACGCAIGTFG